ncbi:MAG TPA: S8 family serine peptidase [Chitinophagales bacterium]|nr:S8 family serine peptidase [Chitinophagales bacterium]
MLYLKQIFFLLFLFQISDFVFGQDEMLPQTYWVYLTDKQHSEFSIDRPNEFLSTRSIEKRKRFNIPMSYSDLPVSEFYIAQIKETGVKIITISRWLNAVTIQYSDPEILASVLSLDCVSKIQPVRKMKRPPEIPLLPMENLKTSETNYYGLAGNQFGMIEGPFLHEHGYTGNDMVIAVLDAGFIGVDTGVGFSSVWEKEQILGYWNFPDDNDSVFISSYHGANVFSIMAADVPGVYVGAAPDAKYYLFRTEVADSEYVAEEHFWLAAAEFADVLGVDIINSSLSYTTFDNADDDHTYSDLDGNTTVITKAADMAASKGILVCTAAGNYAEGAWHYIGAPADGDSVFAIGSVDGDRRYSSFSSVGPTADGRIKPDIATQGGSAAVLSLEGSVSIGSGTSYASPLAAGASAILWQAHPDKTNMEIMQALKQSASIAKNPNNKLGWGIPNLFLADLILKGFDSQQSDELFTVFPNPVQTNLYLIVYDKITADATIEIYDSSGKKILSVNPEYSDAEINPILIQNFPQYTASGIYFIRVITNSKSQTSEILVANP